MPRVRQAVWVAMLLAICMTEDLFAQCAMCRRALLSPEGQQMIAAFRSGILFLLAAPFVVFGTIAVLAVRVLRRSTALVLPAGATPLEDPSGGSAGGKALVVGR